MHRGHMVAIVCSCDIDPYLLISELVNSSVSLVPGCLDKEGQAPLVTKLPRENKRQSQFPSCLPPVPKLSG